MNIAIITEDFIHLLALQKLINEIKPAINVATFRDIDGLRAADESKVEVILMSKDMYIHDLCNLCRYVKENKIKSVCLFSDRQSSNLPFMQQHIDISQQITHIKESLVKFLDSIEEIDTPWTMPQLPATRGNNFQILEKIYLGKSLLSIATEHNISPKSVSSLKRRTMKKLNCDNFELQKLWSNRPSCIFKK